MTFDQRFRERIDKDFSISNPVNTGFKMNNFHFHDVFEIYFSQSDGFQYFIDDQIYEVHKNDLFVINHMDLHKTVVPSDICYSRYVITFRPEIIPDFSAYDADLLECFLNRNVNFCHQLHLTDSQTESLISLFQKALYYWNSSSYGSIVLQRTTLMEILVLVNSFYREAQTCNKDAAAYENNSIKPLLEYIDRNLDRNLSLDHIAEVFFISKFHLCYLFKQFTGFSINQYIIHKRILKARELLMKNIPITQVGKMVGFNNCSHFIRTFKKLVGVPPKQYSLRK